MHFKIGEKVTFLHEAGWGIIRAFKDDLVIIEDETGFERSVALNELVKIHIEQKDTLEEIPLSFSEKDVGRDDRSKMVDTQKFKDFWEIDLHAHELLESERGMSNAEILSHQMFVLKSSFSKACDQHVRKLIIIHGVGKGVLKGEVRAFLQEQEGINYYDADYNEYGKGATEVRLYFR